jgi:hypothetical protein
MSNSNSDGNEGNQNQSNTPSSSQDTPPPKLTKEMISQSRIIAKGNNIREVGKLVNKFGGKAKDWVKKSTSVINVDGKDAEIHWYENKAVGKVKIKTVFLD